MTKKEKEIVDTIKFKEQVLTLFALKKRDEAIELIVKEIEKNNHIYTTKDDIKSEMWIYNEGIYVPQGKSHVKEITRQILGELYNTHIINTTIARIEADTFIDYDKFFATNYINEIPLLNGILDINTRKLKPFNPKQVFFNKLPINYNPKAKCPKIISHLKNVFSTKEDINLLIQMIGFLLLKEYKFEKAFMYLGNGRNGKSKTNEMITRFIGAENCSHVPLKNLHEESFSLSELFGKMANICSDLSKTDLKETGIIKSLIGRDTIQAKRKFLRDLNFINHAKLIFSANELPIIYDMSDGFWTKWIIFEYPYQFVSEKTYKNIPKDKIKNYKIANPDIIKEITTPQEFSGLLNIVLDGLQQIIKNKDFTYSKNTQQVKELWVRKSDSFTAFCFDNIKENINTRIEKRKLRQYFHKYTKLHKISGCSNLKIKIILENLYGVSEYQDFQTGKRYWEGISIHNLKELGFDTKEENTKISPK